MSVWTAAAGAQTFVARPPAEARRLFAFRERNRLRVADDRDVHRGTQQALLRSEAGVDRLDRDAGRRGDRGERRARPTVRVEQFGRGREHLGARLRRLPGPARRVVRARSGLRLRIGRGLRFRGRHGLHSRSIPDSIQSCSSEYGCQSTGPTNRGAPRCCCNVLPTTAQPVAADTWLIPTLAESPTGGVFGAHSLVIRGREPMLVDTGSALVRDAWLEQAFSVVDPDGRAVDLPVPRRPRPHRQPRRACSTRCPNATLVANFGIVGRLALDTELPLDRMRWLDAGDTLDIGDRQLTIVRPPTFDSPATRGLPRLEDAAAVGRRLVRLARAGRGLRSGRRAARAVRAELRDVEHVEHPVARVAGHRAVRRARADDSRAADRYRRQCARAGAARRARSTTPSRRTQALAAQPPVPQPGQPMLDELLATLLVPASA